ncbi:MAG: SIR2 family protein [bacterium]
MKIDCLKNIIQSSNINFLIGSGLSRDYLITLGNIESLLETLESADFEEDKKNIIKASLFKKYFEEVILKCVDSYEKGKKETTDFDKTLSNYKNFLKYLNTILLYRYMPIHSKQVNLFTTNIDLFFERAFEETNVESNDGFKGRIKPVFNLSNFQKSYKKTSLHYKNTSEIPVFNLLKLHGSVNWKKEDENIILSDFQEIESVKKTLEQLKSLIKVTEKSDIETLKKETEKIKSSLNPTHVKNFIENYNKIQIVNPTKEKFKTTLLNTYYYELLRLFANEMEKENTLLFALGFSFADEHIREITIRALNSNPTAQLYIITYDTNAKSDIENNLEFSKNRFLNGNIKIVDPETFNAYNNDDENISKVSCFDFENINKSIFEVLASKVSPTIPEKNG